MKNYLLNRLPDLICIAGLYNLLLKIIGINYLYSILMIFGIFFLLSSKISFNKKPDLIFILLILLILFNSSLLLLFNGINLGTTIKGLVLFIIPTAFWFLFFKTQPNYDYNQLIIRLRYHVGIIAILGIIQYYISPSLFGLLLIDSNVSNSILWANDSSDKSYMLYFRATSILTSPQVFGAFIALYFIAYNTIAKTQHIKSVLFSLLLLISGGHSGNKSFFLLIGLFFFIKSIRDKAYVRLITFISCTLIIATISIDSFIIKRVFENPDVASEEKYGRLQIWEKIVSDIDFFGKGAGSAISSSFSQTNKVTESYFLQILVEFGIIPFLLFIFLLIINRHKLKNESILICFELSVLSMLFVQAFPSPSFLIFWGLLFWGINKYNFQDN